MDKSSSLSASAEVPIAYEGFITDITELVRVQENLRKSEERYRTLVDSVADGITLHDEQGRFLDVNVRICEMSGYTREEMLNMAVRDVQATHSQEELVTFWKGMRVGEHQIHSTVARRKDGSTFPVEVHVSLVKTEERRWFLAVVRDVTEKKKAEEELRKLSLAVEQSPSMVIVTDPKGTIEYVNPGFTAISGYSREEAIGKNPNILKSGKHPSELYKTLWETISSGRVWAGEIQNKKRTATCSGFPP